MDPSPDFARDSAARLRASLGARYFPWFAAAMAVALSLRTLGAGFVTDDFVHRYMVGDRGPFSGRCLALFSFFDATGITGASAKRMGIVPWYALDSYRLSFFRPLSALTHCIDYNLFPGAPWVMHLESVLWLGVAVLAASAVYRTLGSTAWAAGLAAWFYAVDDAHGPIVGWLASRNALMSATFGALALYAHDRARRYGARAGAWLGPAAFACALLSAEAGIHALGYVLAYAVCVEGGSARARLRSIAPYLIVTAVWGATYYAMGHGAKGSSEYLDPVASPLAFARESIVRIPILVAATFGGPSATYAQTLPLEQQASLAVSCVFVTAVIAVALLPIWRRTPRAGFWLLGSGLAAVTSATAPLTDRVVPQIALGAFMVLSESVRTIALDWSERRGSVSRRLAPASLAALGILVHGAVAPVRLFERGLEVARFGRTIDIGSQSFEDHARGGKRLLALRGPDLLWCTFSLALTYMHETGKMMPGQCLSGGPSRTVLERRDARTFVLKPERGFLDAPNNRLYFGPDQSFVRGDTLPVADMLVTIEDATPEGEPTEASFRFDRPLDDPAYVWTTFRDGAYIPVTLPAIGETLVLEETPQGISP